MPLYRLVLCPKCGAARVIERGPKTASCQKCRHRFEAEGALTLFKSERLDEVQAAYGRHNEERARHG